MRIVLLNAGKSTRLGGQNKLFVQAGGVPVHKWHERALAGHDVALVARKDTLLQSTAAMPWINRYVGHDATDGPLGALAAYLRRYDDDRQIAVLYSDTLIAPQPIPAGDWVGVAPLSNRTWDHLVGEGERRHWVKQTPDWLVGVGLYAFADTDRLRQCIEYLGVHSDSHLPELLNLYGVGGRVTTHRIIGWHDAGDLQAVANVPLFYSPTGER